MENNNLIKYDLQKLINKIKIFVINLDLENEKFYNFEELFIQTEHIMKKYLTKIKENINNINNFNNLKEITKDYDINPVFQLLYIWVPNFESYNDEMKNNIVLSIHDIVIKSIVLEPSVKWTDKNI
jgi:hypothetical protein